ncbi:MAG: aminopeptidase P family protein [Candidatus Latescibacteria bacterium]|nr:aminopeptidase P family protein [Candidatus Latescibacterota bacterium]
MPSLVDRPRASRILHESDLDLLIASRRENVAYLTGVFSHLYWEYPEVAHCLEREDDGCDAPYYFAALPRASDSPPFVVAHTGRASLWQRESWMTDVKPCCWKEHGQTPVDRLVEGIEDRGLSNGRLGVEMRHLPAGILSDLQQRLPQATFTDATDLLWRLRMVKTAEELARQRHAYQIGETVYSGVFDALRDNPRRPVQELRGLEMAIATEAGCPPLHFGYLFPQDNAAKRAWAPDAGGYTTAPGDTILLDLGLIWHGYTTDFGRVASIGKASQTVRDAFERVRDLRRTIEAAIRPGVRACDVWNAAAQFQQHRGEPVNEGVGHSLGIECHEPPRLAPDDETVLETGMTIVIELVASVEHIAFLLEDAGLITEQGWESLTTFGTDLIEIL